MKSETLKAIIMENAYKSHALLKKYYQFDVNSNML